MNTEARLYAINKCTAEYFHYLLHQPDGADAKRYLYETRQLSDETVRAYCLGYAPNDKKRLLYYLRKKGFSEEEMIAANLAVKTESGEVIARFRNRVMFPITDACSRIIAFGGRLMSNEKSKWAPKYLNTSDTEIFRKSSILFSFDRAARSKFRYVLLCEGYMDVISLYSAGFDNAVASLGTALTEEQIVLLRGITDSVVIAYDADEPGQTAADKAVYALSQVGLIVRILQVPKANGSSEPVAKDPDEFIHRFGRDAFLSLIENASDEFSFRMRRLQVNNDVSTEFGALNALNESIRLITMQQ